VAQLGARLDGIEEVVGSNPIGSTKIDVISPPILIKIKRVLIVAVVLVAALFGGDYLYVRIRAMHPKPADPFESIKSLRVLAIPEKSSKTEYEVDALNPEQTVTCVHSLFPHMGYSPCWYVKPRINQPIPM
jgi:hypothetical protein